MSSDESDPLSVTLAQNGVTEPEPLRKAYELEREQELAKLRAERAQVENESTAKTVASAIANQFEAEDLALILKTGLKAWLENQNQSSPESGASQEQTQDPEPSPAKELVNGNGPQP